MCGRFTLRTPLSVLIEQFELPAESQRLLFDPRYNIAPTQEVLAIRQRRESARRELVPMRWGLVPAWSKAPTSGRPLINARADTLANKPTFRTAYRRRRCLIPADGFYEWHKVGSRKQPYLIHQRDNRPFAFAGLWEHWEKGPIIESCTIITTDANAALRELHDRMPVVISPGDYERWLDPAIDDPAELQHLLAPCGEDVFCAQPHDQPLELDASPIIRRVVPLHGEIGR